MGIIRHRKSSHQLLFQYTERRIRTMTLSTTFLVYVVSVALTFVVFMTTAIIYNWPNVSLFRDLPHYVIVAIYFAR